MSTSGPCVPAQAAAGCLNGRSSKPTLLPGLQGAPVEGSQMPVGFCLLGHLRHHCAACIHSPGCPGPWRTRKAACPPRSQHAQTRPMSD